MVDEETLVAFYDERIPADVVSGRHFDSWWKKDLPPAARTCSTSPRRCCAPPRPRGVDRAAYPDHVEAGGLTLPLSYAFEPGTRSDGVTVDVPVAALHQVDPTPFTWQVPGLREELVTALIRTLPKQLRRLFAPAPDHARAVLARLQAGRGEPLLDGLERELGRMRGVDIPREAWELDRLPEHLTVTFRVVDEAGREVASGTDLDGAARAAGPEGARGAGRRGRRHRAHRAHHLVVRHAAPRAPDAPRGARRHRLPGAGRPRHERGRAGLPDRGRARPRPPSRRPAAAAAGDPVAGPAGAARTGQRGEARAVPQPARLGGRAARRLRHGRRRRPDRRGGRPGVGRALLRPAAGAVPRPARRHHAAGAAGRARRARWSGTGCRRSWPSCAPGAGGRRRRHHRPARRAGRARASPPPPGAARLADVARYLEAVERRIEKLRADPARDAAWTAQVRVVADEYAAELAALPPGVEPRRSCARSAG